MSLQEFYGILLDNAIEASEESKKNFLILFLEMMKKITGN